MNSGPIKLVGNVYLVDRANLADVNDGLLAGELVGRLEEVPAYKLTTDVQLGKKSNAAPQWTRFRGDTIELLLTLADWNENLVSLISNKRNSGSSFSPNGGVGVKDGHFLRESNYSALVIRDGTSPQNYPALYIPWAVCFSTEYLAAAGVGHSAQCQMFIASVAYKTDEPAYDYGDITGFAANHGQ